MWFSGRKRKVKARGHRKSWGLKEVKVRLYGYGKNKFEEKVLMTLVGVPGAIGFRCEVKALPLGHWLKTVNFGQFLSEPPRVFIPGSEGWEEDQIAGDCFSTKVNRQSARAS